MSDPAKTSRFGAPVFRVALGGPKVGCRFSDLQLDLSQLPFGGGCGGKEGGADHSVDAAAGGGRDDDRRLAKHEGPGGDVCYRQGWQNGGKSLRCTARKGLSRGQIGGKKLWCERDFPGGRTQPGCSVGTNRGQNRKRTYGSYVRKSLIFLVAGTGFEPATFGL